MNKTEVDGLGLTTVNGHQRERIKQLHKKLHLKNNEELSNYSNKAISTSNEVTRMTINDVKKYLGEPLPLPYLINENPVLPQANNSLPRRTYKSIDVLRYKEDSNNKVNDKDDIRLRRNTNKELKDSLWRLRNERRTTMIDQSVQTIDSLDAPLDDSIILTSKEEIDDIIHQFHEGFNKDNSKNNLQISKDTNLIRFLILLSILYSFITYILVLILKNV